MYIGRIVSIARTLDGRMCAGYRVSSRSFPNRVAVAKDDTISIVPKAGSETDVLKNPYIAYNCARIVCGRTVAVVSNGSHTDVIAEKIESGMPVRDAAAYGLLALDYEKDQYNTPRICAIADRRDEGSGWLGIVRDNGLEVRRVYVEAGRFWYVATYEEVHICEQPRGNFPAATAEEACAFLLSGGIFAERSHPITAAAAMASEDGFVLATKDFGESGARGA